MYDSRKIGEILHMKKLRIMKIIALIMTTVLIMSVGLGNTAYAAKTDDAEAQENEISTEPVTRADGGKFRIAYIDYDEYLVASRQVYYILSGLQELGWIKENGIPFTLKEIEQKNMSTRDMYAILQETDLGPYIEFVKDGFFYLGYDDRNKVASALKSRAGKDIDMIITFGTSAGIFVKELNLPIPMMDFSATDPVASGIIDSSTEGSGNPNVWAQVEPESTFRQVKYYYLNKPFKKLGSIVYGDEIIAGFPDVTRCSQEYGFEVVKYNIDEQPRETQEELEVYYKMVGELISKMSEEGIDAFLLPVDVINEVERLQKLLIPLYNKNIPIYLLDDPQAVKYGGLMLISANDMVNVGRFIADAIAKVFNGAEAGSLPCVYSSAPGIYVNYKVAQRIHFPLKFNFLVVCDEIYS
jgi:hypothetical protein